MAVNSQKYPVGMQPRLHTSKDGIKSFSLSREYTHDGKLGISEARGYFTGRNS